ncbi:hypothetical protein [Robertmurraya sp. FSL R5-0851]|uniref:hypothetical protein n=1 Tax=Robertmurraya sp. FSL R5-0851 TaxID=2921584 RepID=UPI0030FA10F2
MMMIEFYTGIETQFVVTENRIYRNGEVIAEGDIHVYHLMLNDHAFFNIDQGENNPPLFLKLDKVTAVLPSQEVYRGERRNRTAFKMSYLVRKHEEWIRNEEIISAVDATHARQILKAQHGSDLRGIRTTHVASLIDSLSSVQNQI